jgi:hypothetical protein
MPSWSLVTSIVLALIIFSALRGAVMFVYACIVEYLQARERVIAAKLEQAGLSAK